MLTLDQLIKFDATTKASESVIKANKGEVKKVVKVKRSKKEKVRSKYGIKDASKVWKISNDIFHVTSSEVESEYVEVKEILEKILSEIESKPSLADRLAPNWRELLEEDCHIDYKTSRVGVVTTYRKQLTRKGQPEEQLPGKLENANFTTKSTQCQDVADLRNYKNNDLLIELKNQYEATDNYLIKEQLLEARKLAASCLHQATMDKNDKNIRKYNLILEDWNCFRNITVKKTQDRRTTHEFVSLNKFVINVPKIIKKFLKDEAKIELTAIPLTFTGWLNREGINKPKDFTLEHLLRVDITTANGVTTRILKELNKSVALKATEDEMFKRDQDRVKHQYRNNTNLGESYEFITSLDVSKQDQNFLDTYEYQLRSYKGKKLMPCNINVSESGKVDIILTNPTVNIPIGYLISELVTKYDWVNSTSIDIASHIRKLGTNKLKDNNLKDKNQPREFSSTFSSGNYYVGYSLSEYILADDLQQDITKVAGLRGDVEWDILQPNESEILAISNEFRKTVVLAKRKEYKVSKYTVHPYRGAKNSYMVNLELSSLFNQVSKFLNNNLLKQASEDKNKDIIAKLIKTIKRETKKLVVMSGLYHPNEIALAKLANKIDASIAGLNLYDIKKSYPETKRQVEVLLTDAELVSISNKYAMRLIKNYGEYKTNSLLAGLRSSYNEGKLSALDIRTALTTF